MRTPRLKKLNRKLAISGGGRIEKDKHMQDYELKISQFIDNELPVDEQKELFLHLADNEEARESLSDYMQMKVEAKQHYESIRVALNEPKILATNVAHATEQNRRYMYMFYFSAAASVVFAFLWLYTYFLPNPLLPEYYKLQSDYISLQEEHSGALSEKIELVNINSYLYDENEKLRSRQISLIKEVKKQLVEKVVSTNEIRERPPRKNNYLASIPSVKITEDDFLGPKIIGN